VFRTPGNKRILITIFCMFPSNPTSDKARPPKHVCLFHATNLFAHVQRPLSKWPGGGGCFPQHLCMFAIHRHVRVRKSRPQRVRRVRKCLIFLNGSRTGRDGNYLVHAIGGWHFQIGYAHVIIRAGECGIYVLAYNLR